MVQFYYVDNDKKLMFVYKFQICKTDVFIMYV